MYKEKKSFLDRVSGLINQNMGEVENFDEFRDEEEGLEEDENKLEENADEQAEDVGELAIDMNQTPSEIIIRTIAAGVKPDDLDISITRDTVTIQGKREQSRSSSHDNYFYQELYWGSFSRSIVLPEEVEVEEAEAEFQDGLLTIRLPKIDKEKTQKLRVKAR